MKTTNKFLIAAYIDSNKANIIARYEQDMLISEIAELYDVSKSIIYLRLVKWGVRIKKYIGARRRNIERPRKRHKRLFSPALLAKQKVNSRINDEHISYIEFQGVTEDQQLVRNILCRPAIG